MTGKLGALNLRRCLALAIALFGGHGTQSLAQQSSTDIEAAHAAMIADTSFQHHFVDYDKAEMAPWIVSLAEFFGAIAEFLSPLVNFIFWAGVILLGGFILFALGRTLISQIKNESEKQDEAPSEMYQPTPSFARALLEEADTLAKGGKFAEAVVLVA